MYFSKPRSRSRFFIRSAHTGYSFPSNCSIARPGATVILLVVVVASEFPLSFDISIFFLFVCRVLVYTFDFFFFFFFFFFFCLDAGGLLGVFLALYAFVS